MSTTSVGVGRRWAPLVVLVVGGLLFESVRETLAATSNEALVPTLLLVGALVMPVAFLTLVIGRGMKLTVSKELVAVVALGGGVVGVGILPERGVTDALVERGLGTRYRSGEILSETDTKDSVLIAVRHERRNRYRL